MGVAAVLITWLATRGGIGTTPTPVPTTTAAPTTTASAPTGSATPLGPLLLSESGLRALAASFGGPVYWVGAAAGKHYELQRTTSGNVFLRYLPAGVAAGDRRAFRTIGTYPLRNAYAATEGLSKQAGSVSRTLAGGWLAVYRRARPTNVYLARPGLGYQLEVFDPSSAAARQLVLSGKLRPVG